MFRLIVTARGSLYVDYFSRFAIHNFQEKIKGGNKHNGMTTLSENSTRFSHLLNETKLCGIACSLMTKGIMREI